MSDEFFDKVGTQVGRARTGRRVKSDPPEPANAVAETAAGPSVTATHGQKRWAASHEMFWGATQTHDELPAGVYRTGVVPQLGPVLTRQRVETDNLLELPDDASTGIITEFERFWTLKAQFEKYGLLHKRGYLLHGPPGSGKTSTIAILIKRLVERHNGIVVLLGSPDEAAHCLRMVRTIEPDRPLVAILEDIDALIERYGENEYLALLDGEAQVNRIVFVATTNYPERLDKRFVDRPSRFDTIRYIGMPSAAARRVYLEAKDPAIGEDELEEWVRRTRGMSIAHLKEVIVAVRCFEQPLDDVIARLEKMHERKPTSEDHRRGSTGFLTMNGAAAD